MQDLSIISFSYFFHNVCLYKTFFTYKVRKSDEYQFLKKTQSDGLGLEESKSSPNGPKIRFLEFRQKSYQFRHVVLLQCESANVIFDFLQKTSVWEKSGS